MAIRITRNEEGNCITFVGSSNPAYWNACLSAQINADDATRVDIINDIRSQNEETTQYEFYAVSIDDFADKDGNSFADAQAMVDYVNVNANVIGVSSVGTNLNGVAVNFRLDDTSTSIIMDNGSSFGVNTIKAVADADGTIHIHAIGAGTPDGADEADEHKHFQGLEVGNVSVNGSPVSGGIQDIVNTLNELFTVGAFEAVVISDPFSTMVADVDGEDAGYTLVGSTAVDPVGDDIFTNSSSGNYAGLKSTEFIDQAGEYFTFDIRGEGQIGFGLVHTDASYAAGKYSGSAAYANPATFATSNSAHYGYQFSHWFHPTPNGSWTNYGASTGVIYGSGWYNWESKDEWLAGEPVKMRVGIDENGYIAISSLQDDNTTWLLHARSSYPVQEGASFHLGIKSANAAARVFTAPKVHLLEPAAPVMNFRYIESPDGNFEYPLFATEEEANYYDGVAGGNSTSHTHTYVDDPTGTTWYMPDNGGTMTGTSAPSFDLSLGQAAAYTEITSLTNTDLAPPTFAATNVVQEEGTNVNIQVTPAGATWSSSVSISPSGSGLVYDGYSLVQGTLADVGADTVYTITVTRGNSYGSSTGSMTVTATDVAPVTTYLTPWTKALDFSGSSERALQVTQDSNRIPMKMNGQASLIEGTPSTGYTSNNSSAKPWATAVVFSPDGNSSNQHIWNVGEGAGTNDDNIYLRLDANGRLYFGWGRQGATNECEIRPNGVGTSWSVTSGNWYGIYIGHDGRRFSGSNATAANLASCFDIRLMGSSVNWATTGYADTELSTQSNWTTTGGRMDRNFIGPMSIGGRDANRSFHGKVASYVTTTLRRNQPMPTAAEIEMMITDPKKWLQDYKVGQGFRLPWQTSDAGFNFALNDGSSAYSTQVWLMGDGTNDSYSNMIRNQVQPSDQNYTKLNLISMVSNDIQTVNIAGLT